LVIYPIYYSSSFYTIEMADGKRNAIVFPKGGTTEKPVPGAGDSNNLLSTIPISELPDLVKEKLDFKAVKKRLSQSNPSRRISIPTPAQSFFPLSIREKFKIRDTLGSGAYAQVWKVIDRDTEEEWAMKVVFKNRAFSQKRLDQEIEALKKAKHPNIICLRDISSDENHLYLRQDLAKGGCLFDFLIDSGGFSEDKIALVMYQLFKAVAYLHSIGIVHRDIKLENILLGEKEDCSKILLSDFGVVAILEDNDRLNQDGQASETSVRSGTRFRPVMASHVGSVTYMAPEFFQGKKYDQSVDIWACGVLLYMMLSLRSPFGNEDNDEKDQAEQISRIIEADYHFQFKIFQTRTLEVQDLINHMLVAEPSERITATEAMRHLWFKKFGLDEP